MSATDQGPGREGLKFLPINCSSPGDNTIVAAVASMRIKVSSYLFIVSGAVVAKWKDGAGIDLSGPMAFGVNGGAALVAPPEGYILATTAGNALILNLGAGVQVSGHIGYWDTDAT